MQTQQIDISQLTTEQLKALLEQKEKQEKAEKEAKRKVYEKHKEELIYNLIIRANSLHNTLRDFKAGAFSNLEAFYGTMKEYGDISSDNKGNFTLKSQDGRYKVEFSRQVISSFDERSTMAEQKLREFLALTVKKKDQPIYELVMSLLERNKVTNDLDARNIQKLYKIENKFDHPLWTEAIALFKESYQETGTSYYARFYEVDQYGKLQPIQLNFASIDLASNKQEKEAA